MKSYPPERIRNVALIGHGGSGKTTLAEAILYEAGAIPRMGRVDDGSATLDFEPEETKRHMSISMSLAAFEHSDHKVNLIDTPGFADFFGEVRAGLSVVEMAVLVVSAVEGVEVQTLAAWEQAAQLGLARLIFVNKLDRERASFQRTLGELQDALGSGIAPLQLPVGEESAFSGIVDLLDDAAYDYSSGKPVRGPIPSEQRDSEKALREALVEGIVVSDDAMMERYLDGDAPSTHDLEQALGTGVAAASVFPVLCGSAARSIGMDRLLAAILEIGPPASARKPTPVSAGETRQEILPDPSADPLAQIVKTVVDPYVGKISLAKVCSGTITADSIMVNPRTHAEERLHSLHTLRGKETETVPQAMAGDLLALTKLGATLTGDTLAPRNMPVLCEPLPTAEPSYSIAIRPKSKADEDKLMTAIHRLQEEDTALVVTRVDETHQTVLSGSGDTHLAITCERLQRKFGVEVVTEELLVAYRETITKPAEAEGRHKKQTGGHGQFGVAVVRLEPLERSGGFEFVDKVVGGAIPRQYIPAVEKGVEEAMAEGGVLGYPVVDVRAICLDGKHHPVDSSELSFKMAGALAFREALANAAPVLLEPVSRVVVTVPMEFQGEVLGDLNARRGRVQGTEIDPSGNQVITAMVPTAEMASYAIELRSLTAGRGTFHVEHDHYDPVPQDLAGKLAKR